jgi:hypothetical protein
LFLSDIAEAVGTHEDEQEEESAAFRAAKGQEFPTCESRQGHCVSPGAKGEEVPRFQPQKQPTKSITSKKSVYEMWKLHFSAIKDIRVPCSTREFGYHIGHPYLQGGLGPLARGDWRFEAYSGEGGGGMSQERSHDPKRWGITTGEPHRS